MRITIQIALFLILSNAMISTSSPCQASFKKDSDYRNFSYSDKNDVNTSQMRIKIDDQSFTGTDTVATCNTVIVPENCPDAAGRNVKLYFEHENGCLVVDDTLVWTHVMIDIDATESLVTAEKESIGDLSVKYNFKCDPKSSRALTEVSFDNNQFIVDITSREKCIIFTNNSKVLNAMINIFLLALGIAFCFAWLLFYKEYIGTLICMIMAGSVLYLCMHLVISGNGLHAGFWYVFKFLAFLLVILALIICISNVISIIFCVAVSISFGKAISESLASKANLFDHEIWQSIIILMIFMVFISLYSKSETILLS